eukprot:scaffold44858_cov63-Phaeocystis_antarctica.AAC.3
MSLPASCSVSFTGDTGAISSSKGTSTALAGSLILSEDASAAVSAAASRRAADSSTALFLLGPRSRVQSRDGRDCIHPSLNMLLSLSECEAIFGEPSLNPAIERLDWLSRRLPRNWRSRECISRASLVFSASRAAASRNSSTPSPVSVDSSTYLPPRASAVASNSSLVVSPISGGWGSPRRCASLATSMNVAPASSAR